MMIRWIMMTSMTVCASFSVIVGHTDQNMYSDIYGVFKTTRTKNGSIINGTQHTAKETKTNSVIHLSLRDSLPTYGPIANCQHDIFVGEQWCTFLFNLHHCGYSILTNRPNSSQNRPVAELVAATVSGILFQVLSLCLSIFHIVLIHGIYTSRT